MKIYLAARYSRAPQMRQVAQDLRALGHEITARWIDGGHELAGAGGSPQAAHGERARFAVEDWTDLMDASMCISFTEEPRLTNTRGGRHVEFGAAYALGMVCLIVGPRENVFHHLPRVIYRETWAGALETIRVIFDPLAPVFPRPA